MVTEGTKERKGGWARERESESACGFVQGDKSVSWHISHFKKSPEKYGRASLQVNKSDDLSQADDKWQAVRLGVCLMPREAEPRNTNSTSFLKPQTAGRLAPARTENSVQSCRALNFTQDNLVASSLVSRERPFPVLWPPGTRSFSVSPCETGPLSSWRKNKWIGCPWDSQLGILSYLSYNAGRSVGERLLVPTVRILDFLNEKEMHNLWLPEFQSGWGLRWWNTRTEINSDTCIACLRVVGSHTWRLCVLHVLRLCADCIVGLCMCYGLYVG